MADVMQPAAGAAPAVPAAGEGQGDMFAQFAQMFGGQLPGAAPAGEAPAGGKVEGAEMPEPGEGEGKGEELTDPKAAFSPEVIAQLVAADPAKGAEVLQTLMNKYRESVLAEAEELAKGHMNHRDAVEQYFKENADMEPHRDLFAILAKDAQKSGKHKDVAALVAAVGASARQMLGKPSKQAPVLPGAAPTGSNGAKPNDSQSDLIADYEKRLTGR